MLKKASTTKGKVYPQYYVTCGVCEEENPLGTTDRKLIDYYLERGGYIRTEHGYTCEKCRNLK